MSNSSDSFDFPTLSMDFFRHHKQQEELLADRRLEWNEFLLPIGKWDNLLIVAGTMPPEVIPPNTVFLYASSDSLKMWIEKPRTTNSESKLSLLKKENPHFASELTSVFDLVKEQYQSVMLLSVADDKRSVTPMEWTGNWSNQFVPSSISLSEPSVFRIVATTDKSFHGPAIPNKTNDAFMQLCYNGKYPENLTIVPMIDESGTIGMILCMGNKETNTLTTLRQIEKLALQLTTRISQNPTVQAA